MCCEARARERKISEQSPEKERESSSFFFRPGLLLWKTKRGQKKRSQEDKKDKTSFDDARLFAPVNTNAKM